MRTDDLLPLLRHMEWADARMWDAVLALAPRAQAEPSLRERLLHIHLVQRAFLAMWRGAPMTSYPSPDDFPELPALGGYARAYHAEAAALVAGLGEAELDAPQPVPHSEALAPAGGSVTVATRAETVVQVAMHSSYHRGQVATQLRALGGEPPLTDFVVWIWLGRPAPSWPEHVPLAAPRAVGA
jgi:uncharacterized damage-inducible protein DinB